MAGVPDAFRGEAVKAWVVLRAASPATEDELRRHCRAVLAPFKVPVGIRIPIGIAEKPDWQDSAARAGPAARFGRIAKAVVEQPPPLRLPRIPRQPFNIAGVENRPASPACSCSHRRRSAVCSVITTFFRPSRVKPVSPRDASGEEAIVVEARHAEGVVVERDAKDAVHGQLQRLNVGSVERGNVEEQQLA